MERRANSWKAQLCDRDIHSRSDTMQLDRLYTLTIVAVVQLEMIFQFSQFDKILNDIYLLEPNDNRSKVMAFM